jgi:GAF domain-containing protein
LGVQSALSLPLPGQAIGAINVYAHGKDVLDEHAAELGELFAKPAAVALHNAQILAHALALTAQARAAHAGTDAKINTGDDDGHFDVD